MQENHYFLQFQTLQFPSPSDNSSVYITSSGYFCHERHAVIIYLLDSARFWIEGKLKYVLVSIRLAVIFK